MSEEYIKKSDAIAGFESWKSEKNSVEENFLLCGAQEVIQSIPAADVEPVVRGKWVGSLEEIPVANGSRCVVKKVYRCSNCNGIGLPDYRGCPHCMAHTDERSEGK